MIPSAIVAEINQYGFDSVTYPDARIYPLLTRANRRVCAMGPFPFTEQFATWTETPSTPATPLVGAPTNIRAVKNFGCPAYDNNYGDVSYLRRDYIEKIYGFNSYLLVDDPPRHYNLYGKNSLGGANLYVYPYPSVATLFALDFYALPPVLNASSTEAAMLLPDEYTPILQNIVLAELSSSDGDLDDAASYTARNPPLFAELFNAYEMNQDSPDPMLMLPDGFWD